MAAWVAALAASDGPAWTSVGLNPTGADSARTSTVIATLERARRSAANRAKVGMSVLFPIASRHTACRR